MTATAALPAIRALVVAWLGITAATAALLIPAAAKADAYSFLQGTKWYVPQATMPAAMMTLKDGTVRPVLDQTVWDITGYSNGYFWGRSIAQFMRPNGQLIGSVSCTRMLGSISSGGNVNITFVGAADKTTLRAVQGLGTFTRSGRSQPTFEMQMATGATFVLAHVSYMYQCTAGQACETQLPGTNMSLADFIAQCD